MQLLENPKIQRFLAASLVVWMVLGAGLWAHIESIPPQLEPTLISAATVVLENGEKRIWQDAPVRIRYDLDQIYQEVERADDFFQALGPFHNPVHLRINFESGKRFRLEADQLELGIEIARQSGQIRHALIKSWILQKLHPRFSSSIFRQNVLADALWALAGNGLSIWVPGRSQKLEYVAEGSSFFEQVGTIATTCGSPWVAMEILQVCSQMKTTSEDHDVFALSMRRVVGQVLWKSIEDLNAFERLQFLKLWMAHLTAPGETKLTAAATGSIWNWRTWAREEVDQLLPENLFAAIGAAKSNSRFISARAAALKLLELETGQDHRVDLIAQFDTLDSAAHFALDVFKKRVQVGMPPIRSVIAGVGKSFYLLPGGARLVKEDFAKLHARRSVWESCEFPQVQDLLSFPIATDRTLMVRACNGKTVSYRSFIGYGVEGFALDNRGVQFIQVHRPSLEFAAEKGLLPNGDIFQQLIANARPVADRKLGLTEAKWNTHLNAYRVLGAIEAIEWYRGKL